MRPCAVEAVVLLRPSSPRTACPAPNTPSTGPGSKCRSFSRCWYAWTTGPLPPRVDPVAGTSGSVDRSAASTGGMVVVVVVASGSSWSSSCAMRGDRRVFGAADAVLLSPPVAITTSPISATQTTTSDRGDDQVAATHAALRRPSRWRATRLGIRCFGVSGRDRGSRTPVRMATGRSLRNRDASRYAKAAGDASNGVSARVGPRSRSTRRARRRTPTALRRSSRKSTTSATSEVTSREPFQRFVDHRDDSRLVHVGPPGPVGQRSPPRRPVVQHPVPRTTFPFRVFAICECR